MHHISIKEDAALHSGEASGSTSSTTGPQRQEASSATPVLLSNAAPGPPRLTRGLRGYEDPSLLNIPELLTRIGRFMDLPTLLTSQLVCREWHQVLDYLRWTVLKLVQMGRHFKQPMPEDFIRQHAPLVQRLLIHANTQHYQRVDGNLHKELCLRTIDFPKLMSLEICIRNGPSSWGCEMRDIQFLTSELFRLMWSRSSALNPGQGFPMLQELKITDFQFKFLPRDWMTLWETLWSRLQVLSLTGPWWGTYQVFSEEDGIDVVSQESMENQGDRYDKMCDPAEMEKLAKRLGPSSTMRDLTKVQHSTRENSSLYRMQKWIVSQCPNIIRLKWRVGWTLVQHERPMGMIRNLIVKGSRLNPPQFQNLETLALPVQFDETEFLALVTLMLCWTELNLKGSQLFNGHTWDMLKTTPRHLNTLRIVNVGSCSLDGKVMIDMLCSLPKLEIFRGTFITDKDLLDDPRPWACQETLKRLCLRLDIPEWQPLSQSVIVGRLAELEQLEFLVVPDCCLYLDLSKPNGVLGGLMTLRNLRILSLRMQRERYRCDWGLAEIAWVRENWPNLKYADFVQYKVEVGVGDRFLHSYYRGLSSVTIS